MDNKTKQQIIELLEAMPAGMILQMHRILTPGFAGQSLDLLVFGAGHPPESFSLQVAGALVALLNRPRIPLIFDESSLYTCPVDEIGARAERLSNMQAQAMEAYKAYMADVAAQLRPNALSDDALLRSLVDTYAGERRADVRDIYAEGLDQKLATVALISDTEASLETWLTAALAIFRIPNLGQPPGVFELARSNAT